MCPSSGWADAAEDCRPSKVVATEEVEPHKPPPGKCMALSEDKSLADTGKILGLNAGLLSHGIPVWGLIGINVGSEEKEGTASTALLQLSLLWLGTSEPMSSFVSHLTWCITPRENKIVGILAEHISFQDTMGSKHRSLKLTTSVTIQSQVITQLAINKHMPTHALVE